MESSKSISSFKPGTFVQDYNYKYFLPEKINCEWILDSPEIQSLCNEANRNLGELNAFSQLIPDVDFFIRMHITKEATTSSRIEGTRTNMEEALLKEEDVNPEKRDDWQEVQNYIDAMNFAIGELKKLPVSSRLIRKTHKILMHGVRGKYRQPGAYRKSQNWIGGATLKDAVFVPPHHKYVPELMSDLEYFFHNEQIYVPELVRIAIGHYQFETIHPFLDGNGRIGRLLITLYLVSRKILLKPSLYLSDFFERNKTLYYENLMRVRESGDMEQWLKFFMVGAIETAKNSIQTFKDIITLREEIENTIILKMGKRAPKARKLIKELYKSPVVNVQQVENMLNVTKPTANSLIRELVEKNVLQELTGMKRNRVFIFYKYINLFSLKEIQ